MSEQLRQALIEFLNLQGEAVYPTDAVDIDNDPYDGLVLSYGRTGAVWMETHPNAQDLAQFLLEYTIV